MLKEIVASALLAWYAKDIAAQPINFFLSNDDTTNIEEPVKKKREESPGLFLFGAPEVDMEKETTIDDKMYNERDFHKKLVWLGVPENDAERYSKIDDMRANLFKYAPENKEEVRGIYLYVFNARLNEVLNMGDPITPDYYRAMKFVGIDNAYDIQQFFNEKMDPEDVHEFYKVGVKERWEIKKYLDQGITAEIMKDEGVQDKEDLKNLSRAMKEPLPVPLAYYTAFENAGIEDVAGTMRKFKKHGVSVELFEMALDHGVGDYDSLCVITSKCHEAGIKNNKSIVDMYFKDKAVRLLELLR